MNVPATKDATENKLFVGGLNVKTTADSLKAYFSMFGDVTDCTVMYNQETGRSRCFGFVTFREQSSAMEALQQRPHQLDGKMIDPKLCNPNAAKSRFQMMHTASSRVFVGGLAPNIGEIDLRQAFSAFGPVREASIAYDLELKRPRGFGFVTFEQQEAAAKAIEEHFITIYDKKVEVKRAEPAYGTAVSISDGFGASSTLLSTGGAAGDMWTGYSAATWGMQPMNAAAWANPANLGHNLGQLAYTPAYSANMQHQPTQQPAALTSLQQQQQSQQQHVTSMVARARSAGGAQYGANSYRHAPYSVNKHIV